MLPLLGLFAVTACGPEVGVAAPSTSAATTAPATAAPATTSPVTTPATSAPTTGDPTSAAPSPSASTAPRSFTVVGSGDILLHGLLWAQGAADAHALGQGGYDFVPLFASVIPVVSTADLAICHMETPFGPANGPFTDYPLFTVPPQVATTIAAVGYDTCSTASNHSIDAAEAGVDRPGQFWVTKAEVIPIHMWLDSRPTRLLNIPATLADPSASAAVKASCRASRQRTVAVLSTMGAFDAGLTVVGGTTG